MRCWPNSAASRDAPGNCPGRAPGTTPTSRPSLLPGRPWPTPRLRSPATAGPPACSAGGKPTRPPTRRHLPVATISGWPPGRGGPPWPRVSGQVSRLAAGCPLRGRRRPVRCPLPGRPGQSLSAQVSAWPCDQMPSELHRPWLLGLRLCRSLPVRTLRGTVQPGVRPRPRCPPHARRRVHRGVRTGGVATARATMPSRTGRLDGHAVRTVRPSPARASVRSTELG
jgi:hypothetical protein